MLVVDLGAMSDDMNQRHAMPPAQIELGLQPFKDLTGLDLGGVKPLGFGKVDDLTRCLAGLGFGGIEIGLE